MLHKVLEGREVCIFGKNDAELLVAHLALSLGNTKISTFIYHKLEEINSSALDIIDFKQYALRDKYYIVVVDVENYAQIREVLVAAGYEPLKDFVQFKPIPYKKVWQDA